jgi:hypothetical protein
LGILQANYSLTVTISFPNAAPGVLTSYLSSFILFYEDSSIPGFVFPNMLVQANGVTAYVTPTPSANDASITFTIGIHFLLAYTPKTAPVKLYATNPFGLFGSALKLDYFNVEISYFDSAGYSVSNPNPI